MAALAEEDYPWREPTTPVARGAFIVIEGLDRAGKTTQVKKLCDALYEGGHNVKTLRFPGMYLLHVAYSSISYPELILNHTDPKSRPNHPNRKNDR